MNRSSAERGLLGAVYTGLALVLLTPLVWAPETYHPFAVGKAVYARSLIAVTFVLWTLLAVGWPRWRPPPSAILAGLAASLAVAAVSAWLGASPQRSLWSTYTRMEGLVDSAHWFAFAVVLAGTLRSGDGWNRLLNVNLGVGLVAALVAIARFHLPEAAIFGAWPSEARYPRISATTGNPTFLGGYMQVIAVLAAGYLVRSWCAAAPSGPSPGPAGQKRARRRRGIPPPTRTSVGPARLFWGVTMACALYALVLTGSLGALAGLGAGAAAAAGLYAWLGRSPRARRRGRLSLGAAGAVAMMLALVLGVRATGSAGADAYRPAFDNILLERATSVERIGNTLAPRLRNWRSGLHAFAERPLLGWGTGNYYVGSARHISAREQGNQVNDHAHNMPIEEAATKGIAGLAAYLLLWGVTGAAVLRRARAAGPREQALAIFAGAALAGWFVQSQTLFYSPSTWLQHMLLLGFAIHLDAARGEPDSAPGAPARWSTALAALRQRVARVAIPARAMPAARASLAAAAVALAVGSLTANHASYTGAAAIYRADFSGEFLEDLERSMRAFEPLANGPRLILFNNLAANWAVLAANRPAEAERVLRWSREEAAAALAAEPQSWVIHHALTRLYRQFATTEPGFAELAQVHFERSQELAPNLDPLELPPASPP